MRLLICNLILLLVFSSNSLAYSQAKTVNSHMPTENGDIDSTITDSTSNLQLGDTLADTSLFDADNRECEIQIENTPRDWGKCTYIVNFISLIVTILGFVAAIVTLYFMNKSSKNESATVQKQIGLLEEGNNKAKNQISIQERALKESARQSREINLSLKSSVDDIEKYLTNSDLKNKLIEKKDRIHSTFTFLWNSSFRHEASKIIDGSIINNPAVLNGAISIVTEITTFNNLHPSVSAKCIEYGQECLGDMEYLSKKKKGEDIAQWLENIKVHFDNLNKEMSSCISTLK